MQIAQHVLDLCITAVLLCDTDVPAAGGGLLDRSLVSSLSELDHDMSPLDTVAVWSSCPGFSFQTALQNTEWACLDSVIME